MNRLDVGLEVKFAAGAKDGTFSGLAAVFGNIDSGGDVIERAAFKRTLGEWEAKGKWPPMMLQHGGMFSMAADDLLPVGKWLSMEEGAKGLKVEGELFALGTERGQYLYEGMKAGAIDGLSIGYRARKFIAGIKPGEPNRRLQDIDLVEVSVVTFPANDKARIGSVKSLLGTIESRELSEIEAALRDEGLSRTDAKKAVSGLKAWLQRDAGVPEAGPRDEGTSDEMVAALVRAAERIRA